MAPTAVRPRRGASEAEQEAYRQEKQRLNLNHLARERLTRLVGQRYQEAPPRPLWVVVDSRFTNHTFLKDLPDGVVLIGRIRGDARLHEAVQPARPGRLGGRPRAYGPALPTREHLLRDDTFPSQTVEAFAAGKRRRTPCC